MLIRIFVDTNSLYVNDNQVMKNPVNFGIFDKIRKSLYTDHIKNSTRIYMAETVVNELIYNDAVKFRIEKAKIEAENERLSRIFGDNLVSVGKVKWNTEEEFKKHIADSIDEFINQNDDIHKTTIPSDLKCMFRRAFNKQPLFTEASTSSKTYYDAGLKDNLLLEEVHSTLDLSDIGIIISRDSDFSLVNTIYDNIFVTRIEDLEFLLEQKVPKYKYYKIIHNLNVKDTLMNINDAFMLEIENINNFRFVSFDEKYCVYNEEESYIELKLIGKENDNRRIFLTKYDLTGNEVIEMEEILE